MEEANKVEIDPRRIIKNNKIQVAEFDQKQLNDFIELVARLSSQEASGGGLKSNPQILTQTPGNMSGCIQSIGCDTRTDY